MGKKNDDKRKIIMIFALLLLFALVIKFFLIDRGNLEDELLCNPGLICLENKLAYRTVSCDVLINPSEETNEVCLNGEFVRESDLYETIVWDRNIPAVVIREPDRQIYDWEYYEEGKDVQLSPTNYLFVDTRLIGEQDGTIYMYFQDD